MKRIGKILAGLGIVGSVVFGSMTVNAASEIEVFSSKQENVDIMQKLVDGFNKSQDEVTVKLNAPADAGTVLKTRLAKNDIPDVLAFNYDHTMRELLQEGFFMDLSAEMSALCLNYSSGMSKKEATAEFLADMDEKFDTAMMQ